MKSSSSAEDTGCIAAIAKSRASIRIIFMLSEEEKEEEEDGNWNGNVEVWVVFV